MSKSLCTLLFFLFVSLKTFAENSSQNLKIAVLGLGGRAQIVLSECLKLEKTSNKQLQIVAICDNQANESFAKFSKVLEFTTNKAFAVQYKKLFDHAKFYPDTDEGIIQLFNENPDLDRIIIASANNRHYKHLTSSLSSSNCRNIFLEKPLFKSLDEYQQFDYENNKAQIHVGLVLRYAPMTKIIANNLTRYKDKLGSLKKIQSYERVEFAKSMTLFMMNWRRSHSVSGGLLLDKSVHDLDLAFFLMQILDIHPNKLDIHTEFAHNFFKKSNQGLILDYLQNNPPLLQHVNYWSHLPYQQIIDFSYKNPNIIDLEDTLTKFFMDFPSDDDFSSSDLIPDHQTVYVKIETTQEQLIDFSHEVKFNEFALKPERGMTFIFENGEVFADIANNTLSITLNNQKIAEESLMTNSLTHAGGNSFVAEAILGTLSKENYKATFDDPVVQLSNLIALISENQVAKHKSTTTIIKSEKSWKVHISED